MHSGLIRSYRKVDVKIVFIKIIISMQTVGIKLRMKSFSSETDYKETKREYPYQIKDKKIEGVWVRPGMVLWFTRDCGCSGEE